MSVKILFADDDATMRQIVQLNLELQGKTEGANVLTASTGVDAVQKVQREGDIDIVLLDYQMPPGNDGGVWAANQLKGTTQVIIVFLSAYTARANIEAAERAGALAYIGKETILEGKVIRNILTQNWRGLRDQAKLIRNLWFFEANFEGGTPE